MSMKSAIKAECNFCMNRSKGEKYIKCDSAACKLNDISLTSLKKIKAHCISCVPERNLKAVRKCTGKLLDGRTCPLHFYRMAEILNGRA